MDSISNWRIVRYRPEDKECWDAFVKESRNATFLHLRGYMDYHADRFDDWSLMAYKGDKLRALLPAEVAIDADGRRMMGSHRGLTYGGWLLPARHIDGEDVLSLFDALMGYCRENGIAAVDYKPVPLIYHRMPSQEDVYALWRFGARRECVNISSTIRLGQNPGFNSQQRRNMSKFAKAYPEAKIELLQSDEAVEEFHALLSECLAERHEARPVHSVSEMQMLRQRFEDNIEIYGVRREGRLQAGVCMYLTDEVAHSQYIASTSAGRREGALAWLFSKLIGEVYAGYRYFDFGISTEEGGRILNAGLLRQKSGLGGSGTVYERYILESALE